jgi:hypothetical protein
MGLLIHPSVPYETNDCLCCAERKVIGKLLREASKNAIPLNKFPTWVHRKYGKIVVWRMLGDGSLGLSYPCILCRNMLDRYKLEWMAHLGTTWYTSKDENLPKSKFTHKQHQIFSSSPFLKEIHSS